MTSYSIIVPVYNNEETVCALIDRLNDLSQAFASQLQVIFVIDGSPDQTYAKLKEHITRRTFDAEIIQLSRNFGPYNAIRMGLQAARGPYFATMAADLQEPAELCVKFFETLRAGDADIVIGQRIGREDPFTKKVLANCFWGIYRKFIQKSMPRYGMDMFGCTTQVRDTILQMDEANSSLYGLVVWLGFRRKDIPYMRLKRHSGKSGFSFGRSLRYMLDSIFSFTDLPITFLLVTGIAGSFLSLFFGVYVLIMRLLGYIPTAGYTPIILSITFSTSLLLLGLGIIGMYVWRTFENTKRRPLFIPMTRENFPYER